MRMGAGDYPTKAGRIIGLSRQHTWYYVRKLEESRLIRREKRSNVVFYELTGESKNLLASCEGTIFPAKLYRFEKCHVAHEVVADGLVPKGFGIFSGLGLQCTLGLFAVGALGDRG